MRRGGGGGRGRPPQNRLCNGRRTSWSWLQRLLVSIEAFRFRARFVSSDAWRASAFSLGRAGAPLCASTAGKVLPARKRFLILSPASFLFTPHPSEALGLFKPVLFSNVASLSAFHWGGG